MPIVLSDTTLNMGINTLKPTLRATHLCGSFIRDACSAPELNCHLEDDICYCNCNCNLDTPTRGAREDIYNTCKKLY